MKLEFNRYEQYQPNGDRATSKTLCYRFEITLNGFVVQTFNQFDGFYCHIKNYDVTLASVQNYVNGLAASLKLPFPEMKKFVKKVVKEEQWVEEEGSLKTLTHNDEGYSRKHNLLGLT